MSKAIRRGFMCAVAGVAAIAGRTASRAQELIPPAPSFVAATAADGASAAAERADQQRNALMQWLDEELYYHVLFRAADVDELRSRIDAMSPTALEAYFQQTERLRELMHTQEWQTVNRYFSYYKSLDAMFEPEQREALARGAAALPPQEILRLMNVLVDRYLHLQSASVASQLQQQSAASTRANFMADQDRMRQIAVQQAAARSNRNYFTTYAQGTPTVNRGKYAPPPPLVTSRQVAQWMVLRSLWWSW
jgi:hypothetical protein